MYVFSDFFFRFKQSSVHNRADNSPSSPFAKTSVELKTIVTSESNNAILTGFLKIKYLQILINFYSLPSRKTEYAISQLIS